LSIWIIISGHRHGLVGEIVPHRRIHQFHGTEKILICLVPRRATLLRTGFIRAGQNAEAYQKEGSQKPYFMTIHFNYL
jgi:hypothetical protein